MDKIVFRSRDQVSTTNNSSNASQMTLSNFGSHRKLKTIPGLMKEAALVRRGTSDPRRLTTATVEVRQGEEVVMGARDKVGSVPHL